MATYTFELGVDWNAMQQSGNNYYLPWGFVNESNQTIVNTTATPTTADTLNFYVFDINSTGKAAGIQYLYLTVTLSSADQNENAPQTSSLVSDFSSSTQMSTYFPTTYAAWAADTNLSLTNFATGMNYLLSFSLTVSLALGGPNARIYSSDPEMVVGADGKSEDLPPLRIPAPQSSVAAGASPTSSR